MTDQQTTDENERTFAVRRVGLRWLPEYLASDGIWRPLWTGAFKFLSYKRAQTVVSIARQQWNDGLWVGGAHPLQAEHENAN